MLDTIKCSNCASLTQQCLTLKDEISVLTTKLDRLLTAVFHDKQTIACQTSTILKSNFSQTEIMSDPSQVVSVNNLTFESTVNNSSLHSTSQGDILLDIFMNADRNQPSTVRDNSYVVPFVMLPYILLPNQPFSQFQFSQLDLDTVFDHKLNNRAVCFYGDQKYSYGYVKHEPKPMPCSDNYLWEILNHLKGVLPDYEFNSVLLTKYSNGSECLGFHSDNEKEIMTGSDIVTISLGETRVLKFKSLSTSAGYPEQSLTVSHGDVFLMSRASQDIFQHSVTSGATTQPRISITLRMLKPVSDPVPFNPASNTIPTSVSHSDTSVSTSLQELPSATHINYPDGQESYTIYIGDSMFKNLNSVKMSSSSQKAIVFSYPGATSKSILTKLRNDPTFKNLDASKVKSIFIFCGANDVDNSLSIPRNLQSDIIDAGEFQPSEQLIEGAKVEFTQLVDFIHKWSTHATINVLNIMPRASFSRNQVINSLNHHFIQLSHSKNFVKFVSTESDRNLFTFRNGFRKSDFFSNRGTDNVHFNSYGVVRLAKHLKYYVHNN